MALSANKFGSVFSFTSFGESHGPALGVLIEGIPAGLPVNQSLLEKNLQRRRPGNSPWVSQRNEEDQPRTLSGIYEGRTLGTPVVVIVENKDARSEDYKDLVYRRGHADDLWADKFGHSDHRGGGRASGRETLSRVIAGSFAQMMVSQMAPSLKVWGWTDSVGEISLSDSERDHLGLQSNPVNFVDQCVGRFPSSLGKQNQLSDLLVGARENGRSFGGVAKIRIEGAIRGLGQPVFRKLKSEFASAFMSLGATLGFELGVGFEATSQEGSVFHSKQVPESVYGGIRGGISSGDPIELSVAFKATSSVLDIAKKGRHDPCIVPRAVPVLEAMTYCVLADHLLWQRLDKI